MDVDSSKYNKLDIILQYQSLELHSLTLEDLKKITNNFADEQLLGEGGFGKVYKGVLQNGDMIAVKKLKPTVSDTKDRQFENEAHHLMRLKHPNIVQLLGFCFEKEYILIEYKGKDVYAEMSEKLLCLEYLPNGNLHMHLSDESSGLDWGTRYKIIEGICNGLHYLQEEWQVTPIIHMDLKPTNILLDDDMVPKIADFGLSRLFGEDKTKTCTLNRHGTLGYMAPEYVERGIITKKLDVFSLGVIIIEIVTGHKDYPEPGETRTSSPEFIERVLKNWRNRLRAPGFTFLQIDCLQIRRCIQIGLVCVERNRFNRPTTNQILKMLHISVLERDYVMKFQEVITRLEKSLQDFPFNLSEISYKVREQVELVHTHLKRAKEQVHMPGDEFYNDLMSPDNHSYDHTEPAIHQRLSEKLHLRTITDLAQESLTLNEMVASSGGQTQGHMKKMLKLLEKIKELMQAQNPAKEMVLKAVEEAGSWKPGPSLSPPITAPATTKPARWDTRSTRPLLAYAMVGGGEEQPSPMVAGAMKERVAKAMEAAAAGGWDFRNAYRRQLVALLHHIRLLGPFTEELREVRRAGVDGKEENRVLVPLAEALEKALELLRFGHDGSRIFLALERDNVMKTFHGVIAQLEEALHDFPYNKLDISDEVREQVEFVHAQLKRAKERVYMPDDEFYNDLLSLYNKSYNPSSEPAILERVSEMLHLMTITDLTQESLALHEMVASGGGQDPGEHIEKMSMLLKKIKDFVQTRNPEMGPSIVSNFGHSNWDRRPLTVPDEFRCPISLDLMKDPVIVATGQTYERVCIAKWLASGHHTCPTTQQRMANTTLTPNYVLRSLIAQWCEANGIEPPKCSSQPDRPTSSCSSIERANIDALLSKLCSPNPEEQRSAAAELRLLAKRNANNRICIAEAGAIPLLLSLLSSSDLRTQEHAVTALLNLSIHEDNKASIISSGAVPSIVYVLKNGSMEARENAAATLFSLSVIDEYKVTIGGTGAIPALVVLLSEGSQRGKQDAAAALFDLCIYQGNKGRAIRAGLVPLIMGLITNPTAALMDEAMAILSILSSHPEGKAAIGAAEPIPVLVEMIGSGTPRNRENAAAVMLQLCSGDKQLVHLARAQECGIMVPLRELALNGTERGKRKAVQLLERMSRFLVQQKEEQEAQIQASAQALSLAPEQAQDTDIPEQLDSPSPLFPVLE